MKNIYKLLFSLSLILGFSSSNSFSQNGNIKPNYYNSAKQVDQIIAGYPFNGNADDISVFGNNGVVNGQTLTADRFNRPNRAFQFNSANGGIQTSFVEQPDAFSLWFQSTTENSNLLSWGFGNEGVYGFDVKVIGSAIELVYNSGDGFSDGNTFISMPITGLLDGNWHHLVIDIDQFNSVFTFYVDNEMIGTHSISENGILWGGINSIGLEIGHFMTGRIDDVFFYQGNIHPDEVNGIYHLSGWAVPDNSLVLNYDFTNAIVEDLSGFGFNSINVAANTAADRFEIASNAISLNGIDQYCETSGIPLYDNISISAWFNTSEDYSNGYRSFVDLYGLSALSIGSNNFLEATLRIGESDFRVLSSNLPVNDGLWHHAVLSYDGTTARLYLDNVLVDNRTDFSGPLYRLSLTTFLNLGLIFEPGNNRFYTGKIDDINYYNYGISASEVEALYTENNWSNASLIASYYFNGNTNDDSGNNLNGSSVGTTLTEDRFGAMESAYNFNGSSYIGITDNSLFSLGQTKDLAISGWFNTTEASGVLFDKSNGNSGYLAFIPDNGSNQITFLARQSDVGSSQVVSSAGYNDGNWHHFVMQMDRDGGMQIYIDGLLDAESLNALSDGFNPDTSEDFLIGVAGGVDNANLNNFFNGSLDDFKIYNKLLTQQEIINLYEEGVWPILGQVQLKINQTEEVHPLDPFYSAFGKEYGNAFEFVDAEIQFILNGRSDRPYGDNNFDNFIDLLGDAVIPVNGLNFVKLKEDNREYEVAPINSIGFIGSARTGDASGWEGDDWDMEYIGGGVFELNNIVLFDGAWKIRADDNWNYANWGFREGEDGLLSLGTDDIPITAGKYNISVNIIDKTYSVTAVEPAAQPTDFVVNNVGPNSVDFSFSSLEEVSGFLVLRSEIQFPTSVPEDFTTYQYGDQINGEIVVYSGSSNSITDNNLNPQTQYYYSVFAYNGSGGSINYLTTDPLNGNITTDLLSLASEPSSQPTFFEVISKSENSAELSFIVSDASGYLVVRSENSNTSFTPADGISYNVDDSFGDAVISYVGQNNSWIESNLSPFTTYYFDIYAFNGTGSEINYLQTTPLRDELLTLTTAPSSQASDFEIIEQTFSTFKFSFITNFDDADGYIVIRKEGTTPPSAQPVGGTSYGLEELAAGEEIIALGAISEFEETNLSMGDTFSYAIYSFNGENDHINYNLLNPLTGTASTLFDNTPPVFQNIQYDDEVGFGDPLNITVSVLDEESDLENVEIRYIIPGENNFDNPTIDNMVLSEDNYTYEISNLNENGLEFKIYASNKVGLEELSGTQYVRIVYSNDGIQIPFNSFGTEQTNFRITSIPLTLDNNTVNDVFGKELGDYGDKSKWRMFRYSDEVTTELSGSTTLIPGRGYWLIVNSEEVSFYSGPGKNVDANVDDPYQIILTPGWNQIGNPYTYDVSWSDIQEFNDIDIELRLFNGTFSNGATLQAFSGGFVNWPNSSDFTLRIPRTPPSSSQSRGIVFDGEGWEMNLRLENGNISNELTGIGMHENASNYLDTRDQFNLPRFLDYIDLKHPIVANGYHVSKNIVKLQDQYNWSFDIESNLKVGNTIMKWDLPKTTNFNNESELFLWDPSASILINMKKSNEYQLRNSNGKDLKIIYGSMEYVNSLIQLSSFHINDPFPNPTNGIMNLNYYVPEHQFNSSLSIELYNFKGSLVNRKQIPIKNSGFQNVSWYLNEGSEEKLKGVYLLRVTNGTQNFNKKIILK